MNGTNPQTSVCDLPAKETGLPRVLIGDNDPKFRSEFVKTLTASYRVDVEEVHSPGIFVAKAILNRENYVLVITDGIYEGRVYDGIEAIRLMRAQKNITPVIMVTSSASTDVRMSVEKYPLAHVVEKGEKEKIITLLNGYLSMHRRGLS